MLKPEEVNALVNHLNQVWGDKTCRRCGEMDWGFQGVIKLELQPLNAFAAMVASGNQQLPTAAMVCGKCGSTELVNLVIAGLVPGVGR